MRAILTYLVAVMLSIHAVLGCCWHHAHTHDRAQRISEPTDACFHEHGDHDDHDGDQGHPARPAKRCSECGGVCTYLPPQRTLLDSLDCIAAVSATLDTVNLPMAATDFGSRLVDSSGSIFGPPLRLHLLYQLLLI